MTTLNDFLTILSLEIELSSERLIAEHPFEPTVLAGVSNTERAFDNLCRFLDVKPPERDVVDWPIVLKSGSVVELMEEGL
jgi:hypothetical protein